MLAAHLMFEHPLLDPSTTSRSGIGQWTGEFVATFGLVGTILACIKARPPAVPMAVGLYITAAYWFTSSTSFANPAVTIARGFSDTFAGIAPVDVAAFIGVQLIAAVLATWFLWMAIGERKMAEPFDFDEVIDRREVPALKVHRMVLGTDGMDLFPAGVADMDFRAPKPILDAMAQRLAHGVFGYETVPDGLMPALIAWMKQRHAWDIHPDHILRAPNVLNSLSMASQSVYGAG